jgi:hypothetical protein
VIYGKDAFSDLHFMDKLMPAKAAGNWEDLKGFLDEVEGNGHTPVVEQASTLPLKESVEEGGQDAHPTREVDTRRSEAVEVILNVPRLPSGELRYCKQRISVGGDIWVSGFASVDCWTVAVPEAEGTITGRV